MITDTKLTREADGSYTVVTTVTGLMLEAAPPPVDPPVDPPVEPDPPVDPGPVEPPLTEYEAFKVFGEDAVTWWHFNKVGNLFWKNPGGDWIDAAGVKQGDLPIASAAVNVQATPQWIELDVTAFAKRWLAGTNDGLLLRSNGGKANYATRQAPDEALRPYMLVVTDIGEFECPCAGDVAMADSTSKSQGSLPSASYGVGLMRFDMSAVKGSVVMAVAYLYTPKQYGSHFLQAFEIDAPVPFDVGMPRIPGLAEAYPNDAGIEGHPDVIAAWDWASGWEANPGFVSVRKDKDFESVLIDGRYWLKVEMPVDSTCSGGGEGTGLSVRYALGDVPATITDPIPMVATYPEEIFFRYSVMLGDDWTSVDDAQLTGGKFPGLAGRYGYPMYSRYWQPTGANGGEPGTGTYRPVSQWHKKANFCGWSARMMFEAIAQGQPDNPMRGCTGIGSYLYYPDWATRGTGETRMWRNAMFVNGREHDVEQYVLMNDVVGPFDEYGNGTGVPNGVFRAWQDGVLVEERTNVIWRKHPYIGVEDVWYLFKNGGTLSPCKPHTVFAGPAVVSRSYIGPRNKSASTPKPEPINEPTPEPDPAPIKENSMTQFSWTPIASDIGSPPSNGISLGGQSDGAVVTVVDDGAGIPVLQIAGGTGGRRRKVILDAPGVFADGEVYAKFRMNTEAAHRFGPYIRATAATDSYARGYHSKHEQQAATQSDRLYKITGTSTSTALGSQQADDCVPGQIMHSLIRVEGATLSAKAWPDGAPEPATWEQVVPEDPSYVDGYAGLLTYGFPNVHVYFIGVGVGTDPAPRDGVTPDPIPDPEPEPDPIPVGTARLQFGSYSETGGGAGALQTLNYTVFLDESKATVVQIGTVSLDASGVGFIDVPNSPWVAGEYVPVLIDTYDAALAPAQRTVRAQLGFIPVVEAA